MVLPTIAVIPARYASERFPGKPLVPIAGVPMIVRVARQAAASKQIDRVVVATDDRRIRDVVTQAGFEVVMTSANCASGSDRVAEVARSVPASLIVNVQGDEPLLDPADLDALVRSATAHPDAITTLARPISGPAAFANPNVVKLVRGLTGQALYFSRSPIPHAAPGTQPPALQHVGLYAYPPAVLARFTALPASPLEKLERLEQLRALENGIPIHVTMCVSVRPSIGVDVPEDLAEVLSELERRTNQDQ